MRYSLIFISAMLLLASCAGGNTSAQQEFTYEWKYTYMDHRFDNGKNNAAVEIINSYSDVMAPMQEILGYSDELYTKESPDSGLSNFAVDAIREACEKLYGSPVEVGLTNFGGIRDDIPKGAVRAYEIYTIFPFDNYLVVSEMKGSNLRQLLNDMASRGRFEALSGVEIVCKNNKLVKCNIAGAPLDDNKTYHIGTINFLVEGGDGVRVGKYSESITEFEDVMIRDVICDKIREVTAKEETLNLKKDGRVIIQK